MITVNFKILQPLKISQAIKLFIDTSEVQENLLPSWAVKAVSALVLRYWIHKQKIEMKKLKNFMSWIIKENLRLKACNRHTVYLLTGPLKFVLQWLRLSTSRMAGCLPIYPKNI